MSNVVTLFKTSATCIIISSFTLSNSPQSSTKNSEYDAATLPPFLPLQILLNSPANNETNEVIGHAGSGKNLKNTPFHIVKTLLMLCALSMKTSTESNKMVNV